jgi:hypothetical protein
VHWMPARTDGAGIAVPVFIVLLHRMSVRTSLRHYIEMYGCRLTGDVAIGETNGCQVIGCVRGWPDICTGL